MRKVNEILPKPLARTELPRAPETANEAASKPTVVIPSRTTADGFVASQRAAANKLSVKIPQVESIFGWGKDSREKLIDDTKDLRSQAANVTALKAKLAGMSEGDPKYAEVKKALGDASAALEKKYGYKADAIPAAGTLWVDPEFQGKELPSDQVTASKFPVGTPVTTPPTPENALFGAGKPYHLTGLDGQTLLPVATNLRQYESEVQKYRESQGMPLTDGSPIGVQVNFEGGGGKGKRYASALQEMARLGVVPTSVAGTSAGSIAAALVAGGADPAEMQRFVTDPALGNLLDVHVPGGGVAKGQNAYDLIDQELRKLTGITDRPVTFADLRMPLQIVATKMSDSDPADGTGDLTQIANRTFVFSQETTPNTPVALAVRASMAIPGVFDPVQMVDPMTGREVKLVDGGVLDNLPMHESPDFKLPVVGLSLAERDGNNPDAGRAAPKKLHGGNIDVGNIFNNGYYGATMAKDAASGTDDYNDRAHPKAGQFMLDLPTWDLTDPSKKDSTLSFGYDAKVDATLDAQTRDVTNGFFKNLLNQITDPTAKGTNTPGPIAKDFSFSVPVNVKGGQYVASYQGGDSVTFTGKDGKTFDAKLGHDTIEAMYADHLSFGDLASQLAYAVDHPVGDWLSTHLPF